MAKKTLQLNMSDGTKVESEPFDMATESEIADFYSPDSPPSRGFFV